MNKQNGPAYAFAVLRAVPHVQTGTFVNVGVVVHSPAAEFLGMRVLTDVGVLRERTPDLDVELLARYLNTYHSVVSGDETVGPLALAAPSERFHWLTAPRSDVLQSSPVHSGIGDPARALDDLFSFYVQANG